MEPKALMALAAIRDGAKNFDKIQKATRVDPEELNSILESLEGDGLIEVREKGGWLGKKIEITCTERGLDEAQKGTVEMQDRWNKLVSVYKSGDKGRLKKYMDENRSFLPTMMFFGVMDMVMFSMMFGMLGMAMTDFVPSESVPDGGADSDGGMDGDSGGMGDGGFDIDIGF